MNSKKVSLLLWGILGLLCLAIVGGAYEANNFLQSRSEKLVALKLQSNTLDQKQIKVQQDKQDIEKYQDLNTIAKTIVPQDKDQAQAVLQIVKLAKESGINKLDSIAFPESTLGGTKDKLTQLTKVPGINGVYSLEITVQQSSKDHPVSYGQFLTFLGKLQQNRRTAQVSNISVQPLDDKSDTVSFSLVIDEFIKP